MSEKEMTCANCGKVYADHGEGTACVGKPAGYKWFPQSIADALTRQQRRIRTAQRDLVKKKA